MIKDLRCANIFVVIKYCIIAELYGKDYSISKTKYPVGGTMEMQNFKRFVLYKKHERILKPNKSP